jgi:hypothetical protein
MKRKTAIIIFLLLTGINLVIYVFRDHFQYQPYSSYEKLYAECDQDCYDTWKQFADDYPKEELAKAKQISDSVTANDYTSSAKVLSLSKFLYDRFKGQLGTPGASLLSASPFKQYEQLSQSGKPQLWCGNFAQVLAWFCWSQGIVCRVVEIMNPGDRHVLNECYIPEMHQWIMIDLTHNQLLTQNKDRQLLDLVTFRNTLKYGAAIYTVQSVNDSLQNTLLNNSQGYISTYYLGDHPLYYYHRVDNDKAYSAGNKLVRYCFPVSWYDISVGKKSSNIPFYLKEVFLFLWLISFFAVLISRTKFKI